MEHPLLVEEFTPGQAPRAEDAPVAQVAAAAAPALPPLPNLPAGDVVFLRPSDSQYANSVPVDNKRVQLTRRFSRSARPNVAWPRPSTGCGPTV
jgi:hypothetical protein